MLLWVLVFELKSPLGAVPFPLPTRRFEGEKMPPNQNRG